jgi:hypothetical protein
VRRTAGIFVNLAMHTIVATQLRASLPTLEVLPTVGTGSRKLAARMRAEGYSTLEELQAHYAGSDDSMSPLNYVWYQYRWLRLAAKAFEVDGEDGLVRFWDCFHSTDRVNAGEATAASLASLRTTEVSPTLGRAVRDWRETQVASTRLSMLLALLPQASSSGIRQAQCESRRLRPGQMRSER